ncbi:hypothetical protein KI387_001704 [Taxus chinensis]|uniref:Alpha/beta hydrolase fold-3 domain-containing protein n=1 Tax=Taxus chinensis TaxID=29808 RepID=A0AA38GUZ3_TAXCH|nr:hypothetical protein KI387_001704 [Taxus chinensis]
MCDKEEPCVVEDVADFIKLYSDGSVVRGAEPPLLSPADEYNFVPFKDIVFDPKLGLWARVYLLPETKTRVPVLLFFHGGGFCVLTAASPIYHYMCQKWAATLGVIIVSVNYRLSPEHRLPAAYHDAIAALHWIDSMKTELGGGGGEAKTGAVEVDPWFHSHADFRNVFVAGESAGGNIAHHLGIISAAKVEIKLKGVILMYPFFGGEERNPSEISHALPYFNVDMTDTMWRLALPLGSNKDHPFCNPLVETSAGSLVLPPMLFLIGGRDILKDKQLQYCEFLKGCGKQIQVRVFEEEGHGFAVMKMEEALRCISDFIKMEIQ